MTPFITENRAFIANYTQQAFPLRLRKQSGEYRNSIEQALVNEDFTRVLPTIPNPISRQGVIDCFNQGLYEGFIATLLWGGKHLEQFAGFQNIIKQNCTADIIAKLGNVKSLLENNRIALAYDSMLPHQPNHIKGVNASFFTKLLYFLSSGINLPHKPLILDNVLQWTRCAFMIEAGANYIMYYSLNNDELQINQNNYNGNIYTNYINTMSNKALELDVDPDKLEAFLFSTCPLQNGIVPRQFVKNYVINNF